MLYACASLLCFDKPALNMYKYDPGEILIAPIPGTYAHKDFTDTLLATCIQELAFILCYSVLRYVGNYLYLRNCCSQ